MGAEKRDRDNRKGREIWYLWYLYLVRLCLSFSLFVSLCLLGGGIEAGDELPKETL